ncbi:MarR family winged helix-turn-helix transcriptional regulator [Mycolicibacterium sp. XJ1819]
MVTANASQLSLPGLDDFEQHCWQLYAEAATHLYAALNRLLVDAHGLSLLDVKLLRTLANSPRGCARMGELADALAVIPSTVSQQVSRLESQGFLWRSRASYDRRVVIATITRRGRARLEPALRAYADGVRELYLDPLTRRQMTALGDSCRRIDSALQTGDDPR